MNYELGWLDWVSLKVVFQPARLEAGLSVSSDGFDELEKHLGRTEVKNETLEPGSSHKLGMPFIYWTVGDKVEQIAGSIHSGRVLVRSSLSIAL